MAKTKNTTSLQRQQQLTLISANTSTTTTNNKNNTTTCKMFSRQCLSYQLLTLISVVLYQATHAHAFDIATCNMPLGMESGAITDAQITASSAHDTGFVGPQHARLKTDNNGGAWCPKHMVSNALKEYLQVDLLSVHVITAVRTQGRFGKGQGQEYTEAYVLEYWRPGFTSWKRWKNTQGKEILPGNINTYSEVENTLQPIIFASKIRIYPYGQYDRTVCLRAEIVGCPWEEGIVSYSIPKGVQRGMEVDLSDKTYDGTEQGDRYVDGLGQLVDGQKGKDNFRTDIHGFGKGYEWIGWRNDTPGLMGKPVEIIFEFDTVRNFSAIILHTNNMFTKDVQVFVHAKVFFSIGGRHFSGEPVHFSYMPDTIMDHARDVTIKLHHRVGKYLKINLYFAVKWIMLSEISFVSVPAVGNFTDEQEQRGALLPQDTREYPLQSNEYHHNNKNGGKMPTTNLNGERNYNNGPQLIAPKPIDQEPSDENFIGVVIVVLTTIIILLVAIILFIVSRTKRARGSNVLDAFQYSFNPNTLGGNVDKHRPNGTGIKASVDDNDSIGKNSLYHEPFNVNMYTSGVNGYAAVNDLQCNMTPDYTDVPEGGYAVPHMQDYMPSKMSNSTPGGYVNVRRTPPPPLSSIFPRPPQVPPPPMEKYYATTAIFKPIKGHSGSNTMSSKASSNLSNEHNYDDNMGTMNSQSTAPMINPYNTATVGGGGGSVGAGGNPNNAETMQFQRARTYNFRSYPDNL
ncbi:smoke alarm isoform X1 [Musca autumnalis]|uniref:smoke alarm isoform X1 n=1 Tax=Musca autumnalis TaxID=221902 RepID=UPI003CF016FA